MSSPAGPENVCPALALGGPVNSSKTVRTYVVPLKATKKTSSADTNRKQSHRTTARIRSIQPRLQAKRRENRYRRADKRRSPHCLRTCLRNSSANAAHSASCLSCLHGLNRTINDGGLLRDRRWKSSASLISFSSCRMNEDLPLPHLPSIDIVRGALVAGLVRNAARAWTYGEKPRLSSSVAWSLMPAGRIDSSRGPG